MSGWNLNGAQSQPPTTGYRTPTPPSPRIITRSLPTSRSDSGLIRQFTNSSIDTSYTPMISVTRASSSSGSRPASSNSRRAAGLSMIRTASPAPSSPAHLTVAPRAADPTNTTQRNVTAIQGPSLQTTSSNAAQGPQSSAIFVQPATWGPTQTYFAGPSFTSPYRPQIPARGPPPGLSINTASQTARETNPSDFTIYLIIEKTLGSKYTATLRRGLGSLPLRTTARVKSDLMVLAQGLHPADKTVADLTKLGKNSATYAKFDPGEWGMDTQGKICWLLEDKFW